MTVPMTRSADHVVRQTDRALRKRLASSGGFDEVVPFAVELVAGEVDGGEFGVGDFDPASVGVLVEAGVDLQAAGRGRRADQRDDRLARDERLAAPTAGDVAEQAVLDLVPFRGARREVTRLSRRSRR